MSIQPFSTPRESLLGTEFWRTPDTITVPCDRQSSRELRDTCARGATANSPTFQRGVKKRAKPFVAAAGAFLKSRDIAGRVRFLGAGFDFGDDRVEEAFELGGAFGVEFVGLSPEESDGRVRASLRDCVH